MTLDLIEEETCALARHLREVIDYAHGSYRIPGW
jgi:hypothetical protein